ncbi:helix-turn-helix transcriptional regulator [Spirosoma sp. KCTC 42546]|uniref:winged helix-turn-helix transcriptional regulator n=1 Tax=Spirosoma sp. KCTC 42546 TaxID=2520506 RepID=UPI0011582014|nr:helix-turn-helix domain-containing protein [Spirosoma sp. KCTC 42546]QDK79064.1 helix-turn-helix transcriptional regulator [Spirosoma sp. KCTC 42546]
MSTAIEEAIPVTGLQPAHSNAACTQSLQAVQDALYVLNGKWKLPIIIALRDGPKRFRELQRLVTGITAKVLSKELKELEMNEFAIRHVYPTMPVTVEYELTEYSHTLDTVIEALRTWGVQHRERILGKK